MLATNLDELDQRLNPRRIFGHGMNLNEFSTSQDRDRHEELNFNSVNGSFTYILCYRLPIFRLNCWCTCSSNHRGSVKLINWICCYRKTMKATNEIIYPLPQQTVRRSNVIYPPPPSVKWGTLVALNVLSPSFFTCVSERKWENLVITIGNKSFKSNGTTTSVAALFSFSWFTQRPFSLFAINWCLRLSHSVAFYH